MVSKARLDFPEPETPVITTSRSRGISRSMSLRLCWRAPLMTILSRGMRVFPRGVAGRGFHRGDTERTTQTQSTQRKGEEQQLAPGGASRRVFVFFVSLWFLLFRRSPIILAQKPEKRNSRLTIDVRGREQGADRCSVVGSSS